MPCPKNDPQGVMSATTYIERANTMGLGCLPPTDDDADSVRDRTKEADLEIEISRLRRLLDATRENWTNVDAIKRGIASETLDVAAEAWFELEKDTMHDLWVATTKGGVFTTAERSVMQTDEFKAHNPNRDAGVIVRRSEDRDRAVRLVQSIRAEHCPMEVIVRKWEPKRSTQQNARHWTLLTAIAAWMPSQMDGVWHAPEVWHEYFLRRFLGVEEVDIAGETFTRPKRSSKLSVQDFKDLDEQIEAYMATEHGWYWEDATA